MLGYKKIIRQYIKILETKIIEIDDEINHLKDVRRINNIIYVDSRKVNKEIDELIMKYNIVSRGINNLYEIDTILSSVVNCSIIDVEITNTIRKIAPKWRMKLEYETAILELNNYIINLKNNI